MAPRKVCSHVTKLMKITTHCLTCTYFQRLIRLVWQEGKDQKGADNVVDSNQGPSFGIVEPEDVYKQVISRISSREIAESVPLLAFS